MSRTETKFGEGYFATSATTVAGNFNPLTVAVSPNTTGRIGNEITLTSFLMKLGLTVSDSTNYVRVVVLIDKDNTMGGNYTHLSYLQNTGAPIWSYINMGNRKKFKVLMDRVFVLDSVSTPIIYKTFKFKINRKVQWNTLNTSNIADIRKNNLLIAYWSDSSVAPDPTITFNYKCYWQDL